VRMVLLCISQSSILYLFIAKDMITPTTMALFQPSKNGRCLGHMLNTTSQGACPEA